MAAGLYYKGVLFNTLFIINAPPEKADFEGTLQQNIKVLNDIFLQRNSSFWTIISVQMKLDFHFAFYFNKVWENIDAVVLKISHK